MVYRVVQHGTARCAASPHSNEVMTITGGGGGGLDPGLIAWTGSHQQQQPNTGVGRIQKSVVFEKHLHTLPRTTLDEGDEQGQRATTSIAPYMVPPLTPVLAGMRQALPTSPQVTSTKTWKARRAIHDTQRLT